MGAATFTRSLGALGNASMGETFDDCYKNKRVVRGIITMSASYATGGDTLTMTSVGLTNVERMLIDPSRGLNSSGLSHSLVPTAAGVTKIQAFETEATEVGAAVNLSARAPAPVWLIGT